MHETSAPRAAPSSLMSRAAEQHAGPSTPPSWGLPSGCTQVPINIIVFHRRLTGRGSRPQTPAPALPAVSEDGTSIQLAGSNFLSLGGASNFAAGHMSMNPSQLATPDTYRSMPAPIHLQPNVLDDEASKTGMQTAGAETETFSNEETPSQKLKTRRKKHRPKVIREDRKAKRQKTVDSTPDGKSPELKVKRKYVRKTRNVSSLEKCSKPVSNQSTSRGTGIAVRRTVSVRRSLHFELEEQGMQGAHTSTANSHLHNIEKLVYDQSSFCSVTDSEEQVGQGLQVDLENSPGGLALGMSLEHNKMLNEYIHLLPAITPKPTQEISMATSGYFGKELAREQENIVRVHENDKTSKNRLCIEEKVGMPIAERSKTDLELNHFIPDDFSFSGRSVPDMEPTRSQISKVSKMENHRPHNNDELSLTGARESIILRAAASMVALWQTGGIKKKRSSRIRRNSFISVMDLQNNSSLSSTSIPQQCMDVLNESSYIKFMTKKRSQKMRPYCPSAIEPNLGLENRISAGSIFYSEHNGPKISKETFHKSSHWTLDNQTSSFDIRCKAPEGNSTSGSTVPHSDYLQGVASKMQHLDLNTEQMHRTKMSLSLDAPAIVSFGGIYGMSNALVPYGGGVVVPYERPLQIVKRQRPRAKVDLDFETTRVWNMLMGGKAEPVDATDDEKEKWWQQEREVFQGRANSFIARMRLVQGDRSFSPWKGSVVDSVVGVFLTQNVADHLSSSAYMALASTFPPESVSSSSKDTTTTQDNGQTSCTSDLRGKSMLNLFHNCVRPNLVLNCEEQSVNYQKIHMEPIDNGSINEFIRSEKYVLDYKTVNATVFNQQGTGMEQKAQQMSDFSSVELITSTKVLQQMQLQSEISSTQSVTLGTHQSKLWVPRNFVIGGSVAAYQQLENNYHGKTLTGSGTTTSEIECQRLKTVAINGDYVGEPEISSPTMPFCSTIDSQQLDFRNEPIVSSTSSNSSSGSASPYMKSSKDEKANPLFIPCDSHVAERSGNETASTVLNCPKTSTGPADHEKKTGLEAPDIREHESLFVMDEMAAERTRKEDECTLKSDFTSYNGVLHTEAQASRTKETRTRSKKNTENFEWDKLRRQVCRESHMKERSFERRDSIDWEAVRCADVQRISHAIRERGMNNILAERIQSFLNRLVRDHGSIDLEWLRDIPPDSAKDFLLSIRGLGLKSVECVRLLTLHHLAFPVDTNVGRICVRLGWVPIQPLPESLQLHLLELYPILETIQKYLWPRLCKLDQQTLYELHYHMITFGKVFCTKSKPNCNACPLRSECKHFASAFASARLALPAPQEKSLVKSSNQFDFQNSSRQPLNPSHMPRLEGNIHARDFIPENQEPIIEEPASPREEECPETTENNIEDFDEDCEIPTIKLNMEAFAQNLENCIKESNKELQSGDIAKALVAISSEAASIPQPKLKNVHRLRTEHYVYELPDSHPLVQQLELDRRELDDPSPYLLAIWTPDEIKEINNAPTPCCDSQVESGLCNHQMCHTCVAERQNQSRYVRGTILVPCRTAMRGSFPLNGTYFQVNEVFADHKSSHNPIHVERKQIWNLQRRMVFFGTSVSTIFKGLTTDEIQQCFWRGFVCVRGFDRELRAPRPLCPHLHVVARPRNLMTAGTEQVG